MRVPRNTDAGPEIGVASTKAFEMQVLWLTLLGLALGRKHGQISRSEGRKLGRDSVREALVDTPIIKVFGPVRGLGAADCGRKNNGAVVHG